MNKTMKRFTKKMTIGCSVLLIAASLTACSSSAEKTVVNATEVETTSNAPKQADVDKAIQENDNTVIGKVTNVDGNNITLALVELQAMSNGGRPGMPTTDATEEKNANEAAHTEKPEGEVSTNMSRGNNDNQMNVFTESGEELIITVEDESLIHLISGIDKLDQGSLEDITVDSIISVEYDDDNNIVSININPLPMGGRSGGPTGGQAGGANENSGKQPKQQ